MTTSTDPDINKHAQMVHDCNGYETFYFHEHFKGAPDNNKKQQLNDLLKFFLFEIKSINS